MVKTVIFTGGGSGGHVIPALTLIRAIKEKAPKVKIHTIGSYEGIESKLFQEEGLDYKAISTGKLRRYFSWQNFLDIFRLFLGFVQAYFFLMRFSRKDTVVFGTGGFVIVPVVLAAKLQFKRILIHEQTSRVGLANKIASYVASSILLTFEASQKYFPPGKTILTGYPLRKEILRPPALSDYPTLQSFIGSKPVLFLTGGGNGSLLLNETLGQCLNELTKEFFVIHQCGDKFYEDLKQKESDSYRVFPFIKEEMVSLLNEADIVISRAGAGTVVELLSLGRPSIFIPLKIAQKNEQYHNAMEAHQKLGSIVLTEDDLTPERLLAAIKEIKVKSRGERVQENPTEKILKITLAEG